jgi:hypothetical protein
MQEQLIAETFAPARLLEPTDAEVADVLRRVDDGRPERRSRVNGGLVLVGVGVGVAIVIAVVALALAGRRSAPVGVPAGTPAGAQQLVAKLAVLRRPQTPTDRLPAHLSFAMVNTAITGSIVPGLTRLVTTTGDGRVYLVVLTPARFGLWPVRLGDQAALLMVSSGTVRERTGLPAAGLSDPRFVQGLGIGYQLSLRHPIALAEIVPDGVARVRWQLTTRSPHPATTRLTPPVSSNVALASVNRPGLGFVASARWYDAGGRRIPTSERLLNSIVAARVARQRAATLKRAEQSTARASPVLLAGFPLFAAAALGSHASGITITHPSIRALPTGVLGIVSNAGPRPASVDPHEIRQVQSRSGAEFWVVPGTKTLCIFSLIRPASTRLGGGGTQGQCSPRRNRVLGTGIIDHEQLRNGAPVTVGVMPASVRSVTVTYTNGSSRTIPLTDGVYVIPGRGVRRIRPN